jgi:hypothetical protein
MLNSSFVLVNGDLLTADMTDGELVMVMISAS